MEIWLGNLQGKLFKQQEQQRKHDCDPIVMIVFLPEEESDYTFSKGNLVEGESGGTRRESFYTEVDWGR